MTDSEDVKRYRDMLLVQMFWGVEMVRINSPYCREMQYTIEGRDDDPRIDPIIVSDLRREGLIKMQGPVKFVLTDKGQEYVKMIRCFQKGTA